MFCSNFRLINFLLFNRSVGKILTCLASYIKKELGVDCSYAEKQILWERFKDDFVNGLAAFGLSLNVDSCMYTINVILSSYYCRMI